MPAIDGIASGMDTSAIIRAISEASGAQRTPIKARIEMLERRREGVAEMSALLQTLSDTLGELMNRDTLTPLAASLSDETQLSVTPQEANPSGSFSLQVRALATRSSHVTGGLADASAAGSLAHGTFRVSVRGVVTDLTIDGANDSLQGLADSLSGVEGVQAYVVDTREGAAPFRLVIAAADSGLAGALSLTNLTGQAALDPEQKVAASDARVTVNGLDVFGATNTVEGAIPGVTLNLKTVGTSPVTLGLERDEAGLKGRIEEFITAYNAVTGYLRAQSAYNPEASIRGRLVGEPSARQVVAELSALVTAEYGADPDLVALSQIGVKTGNNGDLSLDVDTFQAAFSGRYDEVVGLLTAADGPFAAMRARIEDVYVDADAGALKNRDTALGELITTSNEQIERIDARVAKEEQRLRQRFTAMELAISASNSTSQYLAALLPQVGLIGSSR